METRLVNMALVERRKHQKGSTRVRLLIQNPHASSALTERQKQVFEEIL